MRVLGVLADYPPGAHVGAFRATHRLLAHLVGRGHDVQVVTYSRAAPYKFEGVNVRPLFAVDALAEMRAADVVVAHLGDDDKAAATAYGLNRPLVRMIHGGIPMRNVVPRLTKWGDPALAVHNSLSMRDEVGYHGRQIVCYPVVDAVNYRTRRRGDRVTLVNLSEAKGGVLFDQLARAMPDRLFLGVRGGHGAQTNVSRPNVEVVGPVDDMKNQVYARTRVLLVPSSAETFGMVGVEALASGRPVIAHPTSGLLESLGDAGIFVDRKDAAGWKAAIERLDDPYEYTAAAACARARFAELNREMQAGLDRFADAVEALA